MKTAVNIPDDLFRRADELAADLRCTRSRLYADAIKAFLNAREADGLTARLNAYYDTHPTEALDPLLQALQDEVILVNDGPSE